MFDKNVHFITEIERLKIEVEALRKEADSREWGIKKTSEGIKMLYKELENKNKELQKLDQLKSDFVSTVSHELRTPMTIIKESISQVVEGICGEVTEQQDKLLRMALKNISRLNRIINNLLDIAKLEDGKVALLLEEVNFVELVKDVTAGFQPHFQSKGLELKQAFSQDRVIAMADRDKMIQALTNLIGNAVKFTEEGHVTVEVLQHSSNVECRVADTGKGMAKDDLPHVFDKFQQFGRQSGAGAMGTGLGMAITKSIVELHKGSIWVESELGKGTIFTFIVPLK